MSDELRKNGIKKLFVVAAIVMVPTTVFGWEYAGEDDQLQYNPHTKSHEYTKQGDVLKYNPMEKKFEYAGEGEILRYNPFTDKHSYTGDGGGLK